MLNDPSKHSPSQNSPFPNPNQTINPISTNKQQASQFKQIKKTFSQIHEESFSPRTVKSQNPHPKVPKVIFDLIGEQSRKQKQNRINESKVIKSRKSYIHQSKRMTTSNKQNNNILFEEQGEMNEQVQPTGAMRRSLTGMKIPSIQSARSSKRKMTCPICLVQGPKHQFISINGSQCDHLFCRSCMHQYVIFKIQTFQKVTCPNQNCKSSLKIGSQLYAQLPLDTREKLKKIVQYDEVLQNNNKRICPNQQCDGIMDMTNLQKNPRCEKCKIVYCRKCFFKNHAGQCNPYQLKFFQQTLNYRQCQRCKNVIQKNQGCNHMTCRCGYQFCYICGAKWRSSHNCVGLDPNQPYIRDTWECCCCQFEEPEICFPLDYCCECMCFNEWQICEIKPIRYFCKFITILLFIVIGIPLWITYLLIHLFVIILMGMILGLFVLPINYICDESGNCIWIIIGIIFLPITIILFIGMGLNQIFQDDACQQLKDELSLPCDVFNQFIQL